MADLFPIDKGAIFSPCGAYRYRLWRIWNPGLPLLYMLMLNPSTADAETNDPTVERCERRARRREYGGPVVLNLFAYRATDPDEMKWAKEPVGPMNDEHIHAAFKAVAAGVASAALIDDQPPLICAGWGVHGRHVMRDYQISKFAKHHGVQLHCLGVSKDGHPRHPLYLKSDAKFQPWSAT